MGLPAHLHRSTRRWVSQQKVAVELVEAVGVAVSKEVVEGDARSVPLLGDKLPEENSGFLEGVTVVPGEDGEVAAGRREYDGL